MNKSKTNYKKKCHSRKVDFYIYEADLYAFSKTINFNAFIKAMLKLFKGAPSDSPIAKAFKKGTNKNG